MKVNGRVVDQPNEVTLVIPRETGDLVFKFRAVIDNKEFEKLCPEPVPPKLRKPGGVIEINVNDPVFQAGINEHSRKLTHWQFLKSIEATDGLEWTSVKLDDPNTWHLWREEMTTAGFSIGEMNIIFQHYIKANNLSMDLIDQARQRFLVSQREVASNGSIQMVEPSTSSSGEPVNDSESAPKG